MLRNIVGTDQSRGSAIPGIDHDGQGVARFAAEGQNKAADIPACPLTYVEQADLATSKRSETVVALNKRVDRLGYPQSSAFNYGRLKNLPSESSAWLLAPTDRRSPHRRSAQYQARHH